MKSILFSVFRTNVPILYYITYPGESKFPPSPQRDINTFERLIVNARWHILSVHSAALFCPSKSFFISKTYQVALYFEALVIMNIIYNYLTKALATINLRWDLYMS